MCPDIDYIRNQPELKENPNENSLASLDGLHSAAVTPQDTDPCWLPYSNDPFESWAEYLKTHPQKQPKQPATLWNPTPPRYNRHANNSWKNPAGWITKANKERNLLLINAELRGEPYHYELTIAILEKLTEPEIKAQWHKIQRVLSRRGVVAYWRLEINKRDRVHWHITIANRPDMQAIKAAVKSVIPTRHSVEFQALDPDRLPGWIGYMLKAKTKVGNRKDISCHDRVYFRDDVRLRRNGTIGDFWFSSKKFVEQVWRERCKVWHDKQNAEYLKDKADLARQIDAKASKLLNAIRQQVENTKVVEITSWDGSRKKIVAYDEAKGIELEPIKAALARECRERRHTDLSQLEGIPRLYFRPQDETDANLLYAITVHHPSNGNLSNEPLKPHTRNQVNPSKSHPIHGDAIKLDQRQNNRLCDRSHDVSVITKRQPGAEPATYRSRRPPHKTTHLNHSGG